MPETTDDFQIAVAEGRIHHEDGRLVVDPPSPATAESERDQARAERDRYREHSVTLNTVTWKIAEALGDVPPGADQITGDPIERADRIVRELKVTRRERDEARAELATVRVEADNLQRRLDQRWRPIIDAARTWRAGRTADGATYYRACVDLAAAIDTLDDQTAASVPDWRAQGPGKRRPSAPRDTTPPPEGDRIGPAEHGPQNGAQPPDTDDGNGEDVWAALDRAMQPVIRAALDHPDGSDGREESSRTDTADTSGREDSADTDTDTDARNLRTTTAGPQDVPDRPQPEPPTADHIRQMLTVHTDNIHSAHDQAERAECLAELISEWPAGHRQLAAEIIRILCIQPVLDLKVELERLQPDDADLRAQLTAANRDLDHARRELEATRAELERLQPVIAAVHTWRHATSVIDDDVNNWIHEEDLALIEAYDFAQGKPPVRALVIAVHGCDDCSVEPGEHHRYPGCPGAHRVCPPEADR